MKGPTKAVLEQQLDAARSARDAAERSLQIEKDRHRDAEAELKDLERRFERVEAGLRSWQNAHNHLVDQLQTEHRVSQTAEGVVELSQTTVEATKGCVEQLGRAVEVLGSVIDRLPLKGDD